MPRTTGLRSLRNTHELDVDVSGPGASIVNGRCEVAVGSDLVFGFRVFRGVEGLGFRVFRF